MEFLAFDDFRSYSNEKSKSSKKDIQYVKNSPKVGDLVTIENDMISSYDERKNELIRPNISNVDQIILVFAATEPKLSYYLLDLDTLLNFHF